MSTVFVILYLALLGLYLFVETGDSFRRRAVNKILLSSLFLFFGQFWFWTCGYAHGWSYLALIGLFYACMGDALLLFSFGAGGAAFAVANLCFSGYTFCTLYFGGAFLKALPWLGLGLLAFFVLFFRAMSSQWIDLGNTTGLALFYMFTVTLHGLMGLMTAILLPDTHNLLLGIGLALFMVSDYFLVIYKYRSKQKRMLRCNTACYFLGMMLVALSFSVISK
jgi:hypothetical protein